MKTFTKIMLAGTALAAAGAAQAQITVLPPTVPGGSDLVLFVVDTTTNVQFVQDLGSNVDSLGVTTASVAADGVKYSLAGGSSFGPLGNLSVSSSIINSSGVDPALAAFQAANAGNTFIYGIVGAATGDGSDGAGQARTVQLLTTTQGTKVYNNEFSSSDAVGAAQATNSAFGIGTPAFYTTASGASSVLGQNGAFAMGTSTYFYEVASTGEDASGDEFDANNYKSSVAVTVNLGGVITGITSGGTTVPVPAAVWLLGSGVLGLFGIGRRRIAVA